MIRLPTVHQAVLDEATLTSLFNDVIQLGADVEVIQKRAAQEHVREAPLSLNEAFAGLRARTLCGIQLRYDYQQERWCDTLTTFDGVWRLTRINLAAAATMVADERGVQEAC